MRLQRDYFLQPTLHVAQDLLGKKLTFKDFSGIITETEAYISQDDPACHAARGRTPRTSIMFGVGGFSYVYFIYGMYFCFNVVTEAEGFPAAVLIRGLRLLNPETKNFDGPGKLCRHLGITKEHNGIDLTCAEDFYIEDSHLKPDFLATPRIGIKVATDKLWRFVEVKRT
ncbi:MAG: DNA-3-methyladenine glycosylase [Janthinobacterium lividum]